MWFFGICYILPNEHIFRKYNIFSLLAKCVLWPGEIATGWNGLNWFQLLSRRSRAWNFSFNIVLKYRYALCRTRQKIAYIRHGCHRISNNWQLRWSTNDQVKNMVAAMSVHGQRVQFFYSSLDTTIFSAHITWPTSPWSRRCSRLSPSWDSWVRIVDARSLPVV